MFVCFFDDFHLLLMELWHDSLTSLHAQKEKKTKQTVVLMLYVLVR